MVMNPLRPVLWASSILATIGITYVLSTSSPHYRIFYPSDKGFPSDDMNNDEVNDLIIELDNDKKVPIYGMIMRDGKIHYFTSETMQSRDNLRKVDYKELEKKLNK